jgi:hypothetical protein
MTEKYIPIDNISRLQRDEFGIYHGLELNDISFFQRWMKSIAKIFNAYSAMNLLRYFTALKGLNIIEQDNVLFNINIMKTSPVRA